MRRPHNRPTSSAGAIGRPLTIYRPFYPEREEISLVLLTNTLKEAGVIDEWRWWATVRAEADKLRADFASGKIPWPLPNEYQPLMGPDGVAYDSGEAQLDPHIVDVFGATPTVTTFVRTWHNVGKMSNLKDAAIADPASIERLRTTTLRNLNETFANDPDIDDGTDDSTSLDPEMRRLEGNLYLVTLWRGYGRKVYVIESDLYELLIRTDVPSLPFSELRFPVNAFYLVLPPGIVEAVTPDADNMASMIETKNAIEGVFVIIDNSVQEPAHTRRLHLAFTSTASLGEGSNFNTIHYETDMEVLPTSPIREIDKWGRPYSDTEGRRWAIEGVTTEDSYTRFIINFCLYLQSEHPDLEPVAAPTRPHGVTRPRGKSDAKSNPKDAKLPRKTQLGYVRVGRRIDERDLPNYVPAELGTQDYPVARWRLAYQVWVRGHWRLQAHGEGRAERRLIWIKPHIKGPDFVESTRISGGLVQRAESSRTAPENKSTRGPRGSERQSE